ncbi:MAG: peptidoglycan DD-metalloendopeptidase family protein [Gammaproteobacteria bacterium]|nr:peptidoglycan DD-metalloendopeptidase family protein [Gammaproteobacteria bacterium]
MDVSRFIKVVICSLAFSYLAGCANNTGPAPVSSISTSKKLIRPGHLSGTQYKVIKGDTLYSISFAAGINPKSLARFNNIPSPYVIYPGRWLTLTGKKKPVPIVKKPPVSKKWRKSVDSQKKDRYSKDVAKPKRSTNKQEYSPQQYSASKLSSKAKKISKWIWPAKGRVVSAYSAQEQGNKGIDIAGLKGSNIVAAATGKVVYAGAALRGYGKLVIIKHNDDYLSAYAHNDKIFVKEKQRIKQGQVIATMGQTGTTRVMLHFEIRFRGKSVNPSNYLPKR